MTITHVVKPLSDEHLEELELLVKLLHRHQDHIAISCCVGCGDHPLALISGDRVRQQNDEGIVTPHISLYQDDDVTVYWQAEEEEEEDSDEDETDWDQYRNDRQKSE